ncbi:MAG: hypothetical protein GW817_12895 [Flavobacteriales bacterium]|nr:hypothetical protein [Flavobacteriales bacterium]NCP84784.1 hypothetical protein [Bacteroidota bacterium]
MQETQLKTNFHQLIDSIDNEQLLSKFYGLMSQSRNLVDGQLWNKLTHDELEDLELSYLESENPENLITHSEIQKKHSKWL